MASRRTAPPLRITERIDYAAKALVLLAANGDGVMTADAIAEHYSLSVKMLSRVLWNLRHAGIVRSQSGWHGGFRLAVAPEAITMDIVVAAATMDDDPPAGSRRLVAHLQSGEQDEAHDYKEAHDYMDAHDYQISAVDHFWHQLDAGVQARLASVTVWDLVSFGGPGEPDLLAAAAPDRVAGVPAPQETVV